MNAVSTVVSRNKILVARFRTVLVIIIWDNPSSEFLENSTYWRILVPDSKKPSLLPNLLGIRVLVPNCVKHSRSPRYLVT